jgi:RNA polymerase sigma-70 factor (ECF subfamily)
MLSLTATSKQIVVPRAGAPACSERSDEALLGAIAAGERGAMQALYLRHNVRVYRFVLRLVGEAALTEDIVSEVFLALWHQAGNFKAKSQISTWILAIARYKALSALRSRSDEPFAEDDAAAIADPAEDAEAIVDRQDRGMGIRRCLSQLSPIQREVLDLVYYHEKSINEVAHILAVPVGTVKTRMFCARKRMASLLAAAGLDRH